MTHANTIPVLPAEASVQASALGVQIYILQLGRPPVVRHSLVGAVTLALAVVHPERVGALARIAPVFHTPDVLKALTIRSRWLRTLFTCRLALPGSIARDATVLDQV